MDTPTRLVFLRHAEVQEDFHRVFGGRLDLALSPRGHRQAAVLADYVARRFPLDALYASPMQRVRQTLAPLAARTGLMPLFDDGLREMDFGAWTGLRWEQIGERFGVTAFDWLDQLEQGRVPDAEPPEIFRGRVERALNEILTARPGRTVGVVCHGGVIRMALAVLLELPLRKMTHLEIEYASVTWVDHRPGKIEMQLHNFTPWRDLPGESGTE
jgi:broad specificity phosphatase PhoE